MSIRSALNTLVPFVNVKNTLHGHHVVRLDGDSMTATNGVDGCTVPVEMGGLKACVPFAPLKRVAASVADGAVKLSIRRNKLVAVGTSRFTFSQVKPTFDVPAPPADWHPVSALDVAALKAMATIKSESPRGIRLAPTWFGSARQSMAIVARRPTFAPLAAPVTISATIANTLTGSQDVHSDGRRVWFREQATGILRWTTPFAYPYPDALGEEIVPSALDDKSRLSFPVELPQVLDMFKDATLMPGHREVTGTLRVSGESLMFKFGGALGDFAGEVEAAHAPDTAPIGLAVPNALLLLSALRAATPDSVAVTLKLCPVNGAGAQSNKPAVFCAPGPIVAVLMPILIP